MDNIQPDTAGVNRPHLIITGMEGLEDLPAPGQPQSAMLKRARAWAHFGMNVQPARDGNLLHHRGSASTSEPAIHAWWGEHPDDLPAILLFPPRRPSGKRDSGDAGIFAVHLADEYELYRSWPTTWWQYRPDGSIDMLLRGHLPSGPSTLDGVEIIAQDSSGDGGPTAFIIAYGDPPEGFAVDSEAIARAPDWLKSAPSPAAKAPKPPERDNVGPQDWEPMLAPDRFRTLEAAGFLTDIVPVAPFDAKISPQYSSLTRENLGKAPGQLLDDGWCGRGKFTTRDATAGDIAEWSGWNSASTGLQGRKLAFLDHDITDPELCRVCLDEADRRFGKLPLRMGNDPKYMLFARRDSKKGKIRLAFKKNPDDSDEQPQVLEVLGFGNYANVDGIHPKTRKPYRWPRAHIDDVGFDNLIVLTDNQIDGYAEWFLGLMKQRGYKLLKGSKDPGTVRDANRPGRKAPADFTPNQPHHVDAVTSFLCNDDRAKPAVQEQGGDNQTIAVAEICGDLGCDADKAYELMLSLWNDKCQPPWDDDKLDTKVQSAFRSRQNDIGCDTIEARFSGVQIDGAPIEGVQADGEPKPRQQQQEQPQEDDPGDAREMPVYAIKYNSDVEIAKFVLTQLKKYFRRIIFAEGKFYRFDKTQWSAFDDRDIRLAVQRFDGFPYSDRSVVKLTKGRPDSIVNEMSVIRARPEFFSDPAVGINCANGFIQFIDGVPSLAPHSPAHRARHTLKAAWHPETDWRPAPLLGALLNGCFRDDQDREQRIDLVGEIYGCAALGHSVRLKQPLAFILYGPQANNGKNQIIDCARLALLPPKAVASVPPSKFDHDPMLASLRGVTLNTASELGTAATIASERFKALITGDPMTVRQVYKEPFTLHPTALHVFATNALPSFTGGIDRGVRRRVVILPFNRVIPAAEMIEDLAARIGTEEADALLAFAVEGASRLLRQGAYTVPGSSRAAAADWVASADPVVSWMAERTDFARGEWKQWRELFRDFTAWAEYEGFGKESLPRSHNFAQRVMAQDGRLAKLTRGGVRGLLGLALRPVVARAAVLPGDMPGP